MKENELDRLDSVQNHLSEAPLSRLLLHNSVLDGSVVKYFELAQLSIQFLLFCKKFLDQSVTTLRNNFCELRRKNEKLERLCKRRSEELLLAVHHQEKRQLYKPRGYEEGSMPVVCPKCCKDAINSTGMEIEKATTAELAHHHQSITKATVNQPNDRSGRVEEGENNRNTAADGEENRSPRHENQDINLINAIKLKLEVKHLRVRLAEVETELCERRRREEELLLQSFSCQPPPLPRERDGQVICRVQGKEQPKRDVGVQIDGIPIMGQTEKPSVIVAGDATAISTRKVVGPDGCTTTEIDCADAAEGEARLKTLLQEQLLKALEPWTEGMAMPNIIRPVLEADQTLSSSAKPALSQKPAEKIATIFERALFGEVKRVFQEEIRSLEKHWEAKYSQLENAFEDNKRRVEAEKSEEHNEILLRRRRRQQQQQNHAEVTDEGLHEDFVKSTSRGVCRKAALPADSRRTRLDVSDLHGEIDKNELLMRQVGGTNTVVGDAGVGCRHQLVTGTATKRVQLGLCLKTAESNLLTSSFSSLRKGTSTASESSSEEGVEEKDSEVEGVSDEAEFYSELCEEPNKLNRPPHATNNGGPLDSDSSEGGAGGGGVARAVMKRTSPEVNEGVRRKVICELNDRLLDMGIQAKRKGISRDALSTATCRLADERDLRKSKWNKFFVIRHRVVANVNGLVAATRLSREQKIIREVLQQEVRQPESKMLAKSAAAMDTISARDLQVGCGKGTIPRVGSVVQKSLVVKEQRAFERQEQHVPVGSVGKREEDQMGEERNSPTEGPASDKVTSFNRIPDTNEEPGDCSTDEDDFQWRGRRIEVATAESLPRKWEVVPKPMPRKVLFNLNENKDKLGSLESLKSE